MALYRKYRPATFGEVVGQEHVTEPLCSALDAGRINHAYLFSGPRGCGKTSSARILARSLNCEQGPTATPCGVCASCVALGPGGPGNLDVTELDAATHNGVEDARELRDRAFYVPSESRYRVFIIDEAHMVSNAAFNALLKVVEEPPEHLIFIFATTEPDKVLPTIRSRTHHYPFRLLAPSTMRGLLEKICAQEEARVDEAVYPLVIRAGGGSPRDSLSVLDQLLAGAGDDGVTYQRALSLLGATDVALIDAAVDALANSDGAALFGVIESVVDSGHDPRRFATDLLGRMRDLILMQAVPDAADRGLVDAPVGVLERMAADVKRIGPATLTRYAELLHDGLSDIRGATAPRLLLEVICARMLLPAVSDADSAVLQRLERLERGGASVRVATPEPDEQAEPTAEASRFVRKSAQPPVEPATKSAPAANQAPASEALQAAKPEPKRAPAPEPQPTRSPEPAPAPKAAPIPAAVTSVETIRENWKKIVAAVSTPLVKGLVNSLEPGQLSDGVLTLNGPSVLVGRATDPRNAQHLQTAIKQVCGIDVEIVGGGQASGSRRPPAAAPAKPEPAQNRRSFVRKSQGGATTASARDPEDPGPMEPPEEPEPDESDDIYDSTDGPQQTRQDPMDLAISEVKRVLGGKVIDR